LTEQNKSYRQIIKSTGIFGGSQVVTTIIAIVRNKILAFLLGATGIGLISIYQNILDLVKSISSLGIETGGVREIATVCDQEKKEILSEKIALIDRLSIILAILGAVVCLLFSYPLSLWAFDSPDYSKPIAFLSICVFFSILTAGQTVILHGLRKISLMVKSTVLSASLGLLATLPLYYFFRQEGIVPAFFLVSIIAYVISLYYRKKINLPAGNVELKNIISKAKPVITIGISIVISSVLTMAGYFMIRSFLVSNSGLDGVGLYQAVWSITGVYLMLILRAMGADFYPRLCNIIENNAKSNRLINEQTYVVLIVSLPLIVVLLFCSRIILPLLYSNEFIYADGLMNWQVLGSFFKVLSWPLGFILLAKGKGVIYFFSEMLFLGIYVGLTYLLYNTFGLDAAGVAYLIAYVVYLLNVFLFARKLCGFMWSKENVVIGFISFILVLLAFYIVQFNREYIIIAGILIFTVSLIYSLYNFNKILPLKNLPDYWRRRE